MVVGYEIGMKCAIVTCNDVFINKKKTINLPKMNFIFYLYYFTLFRPVLVSKVYKFKQASVYICYSFLVQFLYFEQAKSLTRVLSNMQSQLEKLHMENRRIMDMQHLKDRALSVISQKVTITHSLHQNGRFVSSAGGLLIW